MDHSAERWVYRAEGHSSLVVANPQKRIVYRLRKRLCKESRSNEGSYLATQELLQKGLDFVRQVMAPLLGRHLVHPGCLVELERDFAEDINRRVAEQRPVYRKYKEVDPLCPYALCLPDWCFLSTSINLDTYMPTFSVEIKPKCGFLPNFSQIAPENRLKCSVCRFCLHQYLKVKNGKWTQRSQYCPIHLYSGNPTRMAHALESLLETPQNNLRIFKDGSAIWGENVQTLCADEVAAYFPPSPTEDATGDGCRRGLQGLMDVIIKCLLYEPHGGKTDTRRYPEQHCIHGNRIIAKPASGLPRSCALGQIMAAQELDSLDIEQLHPLYERVRKHLAATPTDRQVWGLDGPYDDTHWRLHEPYPVTHDDGSIQFAVRKVREFLVSRTAKDCSVMVAVQPLPPNVDPKSLAETSRDLHVVTSQPGVSYIFSVAVIDLDPKPWDKIATYFSEDQNIVAHYKEVTSMRALTTDAADDSYSGNPGFPTTNGNVFISAEGDPHTDSKETS